MKGFQTVRLAVTDWAATLSDPVARAGLEAELVEILTPDVLRHLPAPLQLSNSDGAVTDWTAARAEEGTVYLVKDSATEELAGLLFLAMMSEQPESKQCHVGYLLAERAWGKGYATELVTGLVDALKPEAPLTLLGGVDTENPASARVLEKVGFRKQAGLSVEHTTIFVLQLL